LSVKRHSICPTWLPLVSCYILTYRSTFPTVRYPQLKMLCIIVTIIILLAVIQMPFHYINVGHYVICWEQISGILCWKVVCHEKQESTLRVSQSDRSHLCTHQVMNSRAVRQKYELSQMQCCYFTASPYSVVHYSVTPICTVKKPNNSVATKDDYVWYFCQGMTPLTAWKFHMFSNSER